MFTESFLMYLGFGFLLWVLEGLFGLVCGQTWVFIGDFSNIWVLGFLWDLGDDGGF